MVTLSGFFADAVMIGFGFSFGVYQDYYSVHEPFAGSASIAVIGTTTMVRNLRSKISFSGD
jgi:hypothetical protein